MIEKIFMCGNCLLPFDTDEQLKEHINDEECK